MTQIEAKIQESIDADWLGQTSYTRTVRTITQVGRNEYIVVSDCIPKPGLVGQLAAQRRVCQINLEGGASTQPWSMIATSVDIGFSPVQISPEAAQ